MVISRKLLKEQWPLYALQFAIVVQLFAFEAFGDSKSEFSELNQVCNLWTSNHSPMEHGLSFFDVKHLLNKILVYRTFQEYNIVVSKILVRVMPCINAYVSILEFIN